jgi:hypothetical protein
MKPITIFEPLERSNRTAHQEFIVDLYDKGIVSRQVLLETFEISTDVKSPPMTEEDVENPFMISVFFNKEDYARKVSSRFRKSKVR